MAQVVDTVKNVANALSPRTIVQNLAQLSIDYNIFTFLVGTVMGLAFTDFVKSLNSDILSPLLFSVTGQNWRDYNWKVGSAVLDVGDFAGALVQAGIIVSVLYILMRTLFKYDVEQKKAQKEREEQEKVREQAWQRATLNSLQQIERNTRIR